MQAMQEMQEMQAMLDHLSSLRTQIIKPIYCKPGTRTVIAAVS